MERYNIYHRKDGRYEGRISRGKRKNGGRIFQYIFGRTREEVQNKIKEIRLSEIPQTYCPKTISQIFSEWFQSVHHQIKESTAANYIMKANKHILPAFGEKNADSLGFSDINDFIEKKRHQGLSDRYINDIVVLMKSLFKYAVRIYHIANPMEHVVILRKKSPEIMLLDEEEQEKLQQYAAEHQDHTTLGIALAMSTGIRIGELCALQWKDIDLEKRILTVRKTMQRIQCPTEFSRTKLIVTEPKSESSKRRIPLPEGILDFLQKFRGKSEEYVLSGCEKPVEPRTMQYRFAKILKNVKVPSVHFHALRHMFASNCVKWGFDVKTLSELLGHSSVEITLNRYVHSSFERKVENMKRVKMAF